MGAVRHPRAVIYREGRGSQRSKRVAAGRAFLRGGIVTPSPRPPPSPAPIRPVRSRPVTSERCGRVWGRVWRAGIARDAWGQSRHMSVTDHQTPCAFRARHPVGRNPKLAALQSDRSEFRVETVGLGRSSSAAAFVDLRPTPVEVDPLLPSAARSQRRHPATRRVRKRTPPCA